MTYTIPTQILGRTNLKVSTLGLGGHTYPIGQNPDDFATPELRAQIIKTLVDSGVNYFDTTWLNEVESLADAFKRAGIQSQNCHVSLQHVDAISTPDWREKLQPELEQRLAVMNYTAAPLFLMGIGNSNPSYDEVVAACKAMAKLKDQGLIKNLGVAIAA